VVTASITPGTLDCKEFLGRSQRAQQQIPQAAKEPQQAALAPTHALPFCFPQALSRGFAMGSLNGCGTDMSQTSNSHAGRDHLPSFSVEF
jgi:hypothetical protein